MKEKLKIVITGHIDHGKSTLIGRLLYDTNSLSKNKIEELKKLSKNNKINFAYIMDNLKEERENSMTIDTTQIFFKTKNREYVIIDAPGHKEFIKNMVTGASQANIAIIIVDINEGIKEQTIRHLYLLKLLGIKDIITVINKMDIVNYSQIKFVELIIKLKEKFEQLEINSEYFIPVSAVLGDNIVIRSQMMKWYKEKTIIELLENFNNILSNNNDKLIFSVQTKYKIDNRMYSLGRVETGILKKNDNIIIFPKMKKSKIIEIRVFEKELNKAISGQSVAILLDDHIAERGEIICLKNNDNNVSDVFNAIIFWLSDEKLDINNLTIRISTQTADIQYIKIHKIIDSSTLKIIKRNNNILNNSEIAKITIKLNKHIFIDKFKDNKILGRFVLLQNNNVCAGGIIN